MTSDVLSLVERLSAPNADVIERLEVLLDRAKAGGITALAVAYTMPGGWSGQGWSKAENSVLLLGSVGILQSRLASDLAASSQDAPTAV